MLLYANIKLVPRTQYVLRSLISILYSINKFNYNERFGFFDCGPSSDLDSNFVSSSRRKKNHDDAALEIS